MSKPFAPACERNRDPILAVLDDVFRDRRQVLEIGSGTGQHAVYFAGRLPHLAWQTSDRAENHPGINAWIDDAAPPNVMRPLALDVLADPWPDAAFDAVFSSNTSHIMPWQGVEAMFAGVGRLLPPGGVFCLYGPFNYGGQFTSDGNARFDAALRAQAAHMGLRDFEAVDRLAASHGMALEADHAMPANNRLLVWRRSRS